MNKFFKTQSTRSTQRLIKKTSRVLCALCLIIPLAVFSNQTLAQSTYSPEFCEFAVTFPDEPYKTRRCDDEAETKCYDQISYTQVFEMSSTVNFRVICNPVGESVRQSYDGDVMQATLRAMTDRSVVKTFETSFREEETYKQAGLVGEGKVGRTPTIYIAQLWIGSASALSVEAELIGEPSDAADQLFSEILKSVGFVDKSEKPAEETEGEEEPTEEQPEP